MPSGSNQDFGTTDISVDETRHRHFSNNPERIAKFYIEIEEVRAVSFLRKAIVSPLLAKFDPYSSA